MFCPGRFGRDVRPSGAQPGLVANLIKAYNGRGEERGEKLEVFLLFSIM